jgi:serine/threonine protein kinase
MNAPYELLQCLGKDELNEVWKAFDTRRHRYVAINTLHLSAHTGADIAARFLRETRGLTALQHPHIATIHAAQLAPPPTENDETSLDGISQDAYIIMDYIDGLSLADYLRSLFASQKFPTPVEIAHILAPICAAVDYAHQHGVIHGLLKPTAILLDKYGTQNRQLGEPRLVGFGMHNTLDVLLLSQKDISYIAPEVLQGNTDNIRSDLYSLGVILYEMCTGRLPFQGSTTVELISQVFHAMPPSPISLRPELGPELTAVILRALARDPLARYSSAWAMIAAVVHALNVPLQGVLHPDTFTPPVPLVGFDPLHSPTYLSSPPRQVSDPGLWASSPLPTRATHHLTPVSSNPQTAVSAVPTVRMTPVSSLVQDQAMRAPVPQYPTGQIDSPVPLPTPPFSRTRRGLPMLYLGVVVLLLLALIGAGLAAWLLFLRPPQSSPVGQAFFISSGLVDTTSNSGITDRLEIELTNAGQPQSGMRYYAWLLGDTDGNTDTLPIFLGVLPIKDGHATLIYQGDAQNTNLLSKYSRLLVTEESASFQPVNPSFQTSTWRYAASLSRTPNPSDANRYSLLDHTRHLLAQDPKLKGVDISGGLDTWLFRNTLKVMEWAGSARDAALGGDVQLTRRHLVRILDYLLGSQYVLSAGIPADLDPIQADKKISRVALLTLSETQTPPGYLKHIGNHLREIGLSPGATDQQKQLAIGISDDINHVQNWLEQVRDLALKLVKTAPEQLNQPSALASLNDMFTQAHNAFVGRIDPSTNQLEKGVAQIHYDVQSLATLDITACTSGNVARFCV